MEKITCVCGNKKKERRQKFCSQKCAANNRWKNPEMRKKYIDGMRTIRRKRMEKTCPCGDKYKTKYPERSTYCSRPCKTKYMKRITPSNYKGGRVGYDALHDWINRWLGKAKVCKFCGEDKKRVHWANKSHEYKRELTDFIPLCVSCHRKYDRPYLGSKERRFA